MWRTLMFGAWMFIALTLGVMGLSMSINQVRPAGLIDGVIGFMGLVAFVILLLTYVELHMEDDDA